MGVAGSYLMARLKNSENEVAGYERMVEERHDSICASLLETPSICLRKFRILKQELGEVGRTG